MNGISVNVYSKAKDGNKQLSKNFRVKEFACQDGTDTILVNPKLIVLLQKVRDHFGKPVTINSAYRTEAHNKKVGGSVYSQHKYGTAADVKIAGISPKTIATYVNTQMPNSGGIGVYSSFCHIDVRATKSRWNG